MRRRLKIKTRSFTDTVLIKVDDAKEAVLAKYYKTFINTQDAEDREALYAKLQGLNDIVFEMKKAIRGEE